MRAKSQVGSILKDEGGETVKMHPVCKTGGYGDDGLDEDNSFAKFSPSGSLELRIANPALHGKLIPGEKYYLDFTPADPAPAPVE